MVGPGLGSIQKNSDPPIILFFQWLLQFRFFKKTSVSGVAYQATTFRTKIGGAELGENTKELEQPIYFCNP